MRASRSGVTDVQHVVERLLDVAGIPARVRIEPRRSAPRRNAMETDDVVTRLETHSRRLQDQAAERDLAPVRRAQTALALVIARAEAAVARVAPLAERCLPKLRRARAALSQPGYRRVGGHDAELNTTRQQFIDGAREAVRDLILTLEEHPTVIQNTARAIAGLQLAAVARVDYVGGTRRYLEGLAASLAPATVEAEVARIEKSLARIERYGVEAAISGQAVTAAVPPASQGFAESVTARRTS
jgi:hypothetical protein